MLLGPYDDEITQSLLKRANATGYEVLVVTLDTWTLAWRPADRKSCSVFRLLIYAKFIAFYLD